MAIISVCHKTRESVLKNQMKIWGFVGFLLTFACGVFMSSEQFTTLSMQVGHIIAGKESLLLGGVMMALLGGSFVGSVLSGAKFSVIAGVVFSRAVLCMVSLGFFAVGCFLGEGLWSMIKTLSAGQAIENLDLLRLVGIATIAAVASYVMPRWTGLK